MELGEVCKVLHSRALKRAIPLLFLLLHERVPAAGWVDESRSVGERQSEHVVVSSYWHSNLVSSSGMQNVLRLI